MPAVPKKRSSKGRRDRRRSHDALKPQNVIIDKESGEARMSHRIDMATGKYKGRQIIVPGK